MTTISQDIRGALQVRAATAEGFPPADQVAYQNRAFTSTTGTPWARMTLINQYGRPFSVDTVTKLVRGLFQVDIFYPSDQGTGLAEAVADAVRAVFVPGTRIQVPAAVVSIDYAESLQGLQQADWYMVPVSIGWRAFPEQN